MKTKIAIIALLLALNIILAGKDVKKPVCAEPAKIDVSQELNRLDNMANKIEKSIKYQAKCTD